MDRQPLKSSAITSVGYDPDTQILEIEFVSGATYQYSGVPRIVWEFLLVAPSAGQFINLVVKPQFPASQGEG